VKAGDDAKDPNHGVLYCHVWSLLLVGAATTLFSTQAEAPVDPGQLYEQGISSYNSGDFTEAVRLLSQAASAAPDVPDFRYHLGLAYLQVGRARQAARELEATLGMMGMRRDTRVKEPLVLLHAAIAYLRAGSLSTARARAEAASTRDPDSAEARYVLGLVTKEEGKESEALRLFREALELDRDHPDANIAVAEWLDENGQPAEAREHLRHALHGTPDRFAILMALGGLAYRQEDWEESAAAFRLASLYRPDDDDAAFNHGAALLAQGHLAQAEEVFRKLVERDSPAPRDDAAFNLGRVLYESERYEQAVAVLSGILERGVSSEVSDVRLALALAHEANGDDEAAEGAYRALVAESPTFLPGFVNLASLLARTSRFQEARDILRAALAIPMDAGQRSEIEAMVEELADHLDRTGSRPMG
jgi:tetratricopeptide (TPR) repeat protein